MKAIIIAAAAVAAVGIGFAAGVIYGKAKEETEGLAESIEKLLKTEGDLWR